MLEFNETPRTKDELAHWEAVGFKKIKFEIYEESCLLPGKKAGKIYYRVWIEFEKYHCGLFRDFDFEGAKKVVNDINDFLVENKIAKKRIEKAIDLYTEFAESYAVYRESKEELEQFVNGDIKCLNT